MPWSKGMPTFFRLVQALLRDLSFLTTPKAPEEYMLVRSRILVALIGTLILTSTAYAGAPAPELDPGSLGAGLGLATALMLLLSHRKRASRP